MMVGDPAFGWDFAVFWAIGRAILTGADPYAVWGSWYPPATSILFSLFAVASPATTFVVWSALNLLFLSAVSGRKPAQWLLYSPVLFAIAAGQIDLFFLWLAIFLIRRGWTPAMAAALITLKPQLAFILLPWFLVQWLRRDRLTLARFGGLAAILHSLPLVYDPLIYHRWIERIRILAAGRMGGAPSLMGLTAFGLPFWLVAIISLAVLAAALLWTDERTTRIAATLANPSIMMYDLSMLTGVAPWALMVPVSWLAWPLCYLFRSFVPFLVMPLTALAWRLWKDLSHGRTATTSGRHATVRPHPLHS